MNLRYLPANQAWVFIFGHDVDTATIQDMGYHGRFFASRDSAITAAALCGLTVHRDGSCEVTR